MRSGVPALALLATALSVSLPARAQLEVAEDDDVASSEPGFSPRFAAFRGGGINLQGYGGMVAYQCAGAIWGHAVAGGTLRARFGYLEIGGFYEASDRIEQGSWTAFGGFAGAYLPFDDWVDFEATLGVGSRTHREEEVRYGPNGYAWSTPALVLRLSVSDRSSESIAGVRVGLEFFAMMDLKRHAVPWRLVYERGDGIPPLVYSGVTDVGGTSAGLAFTLGFDLSLGTAGAMRPSRAGPG